MSRKLVTGSSFKTEKGILQFSAYWGSSSQHLWNPQKLQKDINFSAFCRGNKISDKEKSESTEPMQYIYGVYAYTIILNQEFHGRLLYISYNIF